MNSREIDETGATAVDTAGIPRSERLDAASSLPIWVRAVIVVGVLINLVSLILYLSASTLTVIGGPSVHPPLSMYAALSATFMVLGVGLVLTNRRDARAAWLGGVLILVGVPFGAALLDVAAPATWLTYVRPDAFSAALLWSFVGRFPTEVDSRTARMVFRIIAAAAAWAGAWCAAATLALLWLGPNGEWSWLTSFAQGGHTLYWPTILGFIAPIFPALLWRIATADHAVRPRIQLFLRGLVAGFAPFTLEVLIEETVPAYKAWAYGPRVAPWVGGVIFGALAIVPFVTAYSVFFDRVVDVRVVLRAAVQYLLARYTIVLVTLVPFASLALFILDHRARVDRGSRRQDHRGLPAGADAALR